MNRRSGDRIYLPAQCCNEVNLPENFTQDSFKMRELQPYKITSAQKRKEKILKLIHKFKDDPTFGAWGVEVEQ